ncbi:hypothetical protein GCM10028791_42360 [Echinicola sediminis]
MNQNTIELSEKEIIEINGGVWPNPYSFLPGYKVAVAIKEFASGFFEGVDVGYTRSPKYERN